MKQSTTITTEGLSKSQQQGLDKALWQATMAYIDRVQPHASVELATSHLERERWTPTLGPREQLIRVEAPKSVKEVS